MGFSIINQPAIGDPPIMETPISGLVDCFMLFYVNFNHVMA
jgi:hypothetical protein